METTLNTPQQTEDCSSEFGSMSSLGRWLSWLTVMVVASIILYGSYFFDKDKIEYGMYAIMVLLALGLVYKSFIEANFIGNEMKLASDQVKLLERVDDFETFFRQSQHSIFRNHISNLYTISLSHSEINQDNLIEVLHTKLMAKNRMIELFSSLLITLGLIGTIIGLILMMQNLVITMSSGVGEDLIVKLVSKGGPLSGLGTAFNTTLLGAFLGGILLRVLTSVSDSNIVQYTSQIAELTEVYVLPNMRRNSKQQTNAAVEAIKNDES